DLTRVLVVAQIVAAHLNNHQLALFDATCRILGLEPREKSPGSPAPERLKIEPVGALRQVGTRTHDPVTRADRLRIAHEEHLRRSILSGARRLHVERCGRGLDERKTAHWLSGLGALGLAYRHHRAQDRLWRN